MLITLGKEILCYGIMTKYNTLLLRDVLDDAILNSRKITDLIQS